MKPVASAQVHYVAEKTNWKPTFYSIAGLWVSCQPSNITSLNMQNSVNKQKRDFFFNSVSKMSWQSLLVLSLITMLTRWPTFWDFILLYFFILYIVFFFLIYTNLNLIQLYLTLFGSPSNFFLVIFGSKWNKT